MTAPHRSNLLTDRLPAGECAVRLSPQRRLQHRGDPALRCVGRAFEWILLQLQRLVPSYAPEHVVQALIVDVTGVRVLTMRFREIPAAARATIRRRECLEVGRSGVLRSRLT